MITQIQFFLAADAPPSPMGGIWFPMILMFVMMYFIMIRPQQKKQKEQRDMLENLKIGDEIITAGGLHGRVANKSDRTVTVKFLDGKVKVEKASVTQVFKSKDGGGDSGDAEEGEAQEEEENETKD